MKNIERSVMRLLLISSVPKSIGVGYLRVEQPRGNRLMISDYDIEGTKSLGGFLPS
jgi:hypothetical protein